MKRLAVFCLAVALLAPCLSADGVLTGILHTCAMIGNASQAFAEGTAGSAETQSGESLNAARAAREEKAIQDARRQQLAAREAAIAAKELELKKLNERLDSQKKALDDSKRRLDESLKAKQKTLDDKQKKMITLFKKMRPQQAGELMDKLDEEKVISMLNQMDTKTVIKLIPFLKQPRVLKWINENLNGV